LVSSFVAVVGATPGRCALFRRRRQPRRVLAGLRLEDPGAEATSIRELLRFLLDLYDRFSRHYGYAIGSHVAMAILLAFFPFLIVVVALTSFLYTQAAADQVIQIAFENWPPAVAQTFSTQITQVLQQRSGGLLTFGILFTLWSASSGVEALRLGLDNAYAAAEERAWWLLRLQSILFVVIGAVGMFILAVTVVLWPVLWNAAGSVAPWIQRFSFVSDLVRFGLSGLFLFGALVAFHLWLPAGRRRVVHVLPGIGLTLVLWLLVAVLFGLYIGSFANYNATYAGLGGIIAALLFLWLNAVAFILGAEFNAGLAARYGWSRALHINAPMPADHKAEIDKELPVHARR
jgi:membrane protein